MLFRILPMLAFVIVFIQLIQPIQTGAGESQGRYYFEKRGEVFWEIPTEGKRIALTFDDGPNPKYTPEILDLLKKYHAKATFFVIGEHVLNEPKLTRRIAKEGHELGNHTYSHPLFNHLSEEEMRKEIVEGQKVISSVTNQKGTLFRPPGGFYNKKVVDTAISEGYRVILWSWDQDTKDWRRPGAGRIVQSVLKHASSGDIILFHDHVNGRSQTIEALKAILPKLEAEGYQFVTVSDLLSIQQQERWLNQEMLPHKERRS